LGTTARVRTDFAASVPHCAVREFAEGSNGGTIVRVAFALLAHRNPWAVERLVRTLVSADHLVVVHYDLKAPRSHYRRLAQSFAGCKNVRFARRVRVAWGEWSMVVATLNCLEEIQAAGWQPEYVLHASGVDYPIRSSAELIAFLARNRGKEFIETAHAEHDRWVKGGLQEERYQYRFYFNWHEQKRLFELCFAIQKALQLKRIFVRGMEPHIGSQWWALTWETLQKVMELARQPDIRSFFRTTLIPDELFFQTLVHHVVPETHIVNRTLTLYQFSDYGNPVTYYVDHLEYLLRQPFFMARKLSAHDPALFDALDECWRGERPARPFNDSDVGKVGREYEDCRRTYRDGAPGQRVIGQVPDPWAGELARLASPYFAVLGSSTAGLRLFYEALSRHAELVCHGQLFHPRRIEFAGGAASFAGYRADQVKLRNVSGLDFLADVVRAEKRALTGFLLRLGQGWHIAEVMLDRPNVRVVMVRGDLLVSFIEEALGEPLLDEPLDPAALEAIPANDLANHFRLFISNYRQQTAKLAELTKCAYLAKPKGWLAEFDIVSNGAASALSPGDLPRSSSYSASHQTALSKHQTALSNCPSPSMPSWSCLDIELARIAETLERRDSPSEFANLDEWRRLAIDRLAAGGINKFALSMLEGGANDPSTIFAAI
jgi:hypothetical protein